MQRCNTTWGGVSPHDATPPGSGVSPHVATVTNAQRDHAHPQHENHPLGTVRRSTRRAAVPRSPALAAIPGGSEQYATRTMKHATYPTHHRRGATAPRAAAHLPAPMRRSGSGRSCRCTTNGLRRERCPCTYDCACVGELARARTRAALGTRAHAYLTNVPNDFALAHLNADLRTSAFAFLVGTHFARAELLVQPK